MNRLEDIIRWIEKNSPLTASEDARFVTLGNALAGNEGIMNQVFAQIVSFVDGSLASKMPTEYIVAAIQEAIYKLPTYVLEANGEDFDITINVPTASIVDGSDSKIVSTHNGEGTYQIDYLSFGKKPQAYRFTLDGTSTASRPEVLFNDPVDIDLIAIYPWAFSSVEGAELAIMILDSVSTDALECRLARTATGISIKLVAVVSGGDIELADFGEQTEAAVTTSNFKISITGTSASVLQDGVALSDGGDTEFDFSNAGSLNVIDHMVEVRGVVDDTVIFEFSRHRPITSDLIYYTLDGRQPTDTDNQYSGVFTVDNTGKLIRIKIVHDTILSFSDTMILFGDGSLEVHGQEFHSYQELPVLGVNDAGKVLISYYNSPEDNGWIIGPSPAEIVTSNSDDVTDASYTLLTSDWTRTKYMDSASPQTFNIPQDLDTDEYPLNGRTDVVMINDGGVTFAGLGTVELNSIEGSLNIADKYGAVTILRRALNEYIIIGALV